jgi:hypothetical protein
MASGYPFIWTQSLNLDDDAEQEWLGILDFRRPVFVLINDRENWEIQAFEIPLSGLSVFDVDTYISPYAPELNLLLLFQGEGKYCSSPNTVKWLIEVNPVTMEYDSHYLCDSWTYSLDSANDVKRAVDEFTKSSYFDFFDAPDWYYRSDMPENEYERPTILDLISQIEDDVVEQITSDEIEYKITELIETLPVEDPAVQILLPRLYYLRGLSYELDGQEELAVEVYLELIEKYPQSLWGQYAQIRIQPAK